VKFGISFNFTTFNQGGALVHVYKDGSVLINHGGTEMGQGLHTKMLQVAATALGLPLGEGPARARPAPTRCPTPRPPRPSAGADLNGGAVKDACEQILARLVPVRAERPTRRGRSSSRRPTTSAIQLWAAGFYKTEGLSWDLTTMTGSPFKYFAYGAAVAEVEVDGFTGAYDRAASTSCTTSATASRRWSTSGRSRAGSCRAPAG
jgi:xanthine dehydrogenase large subunit